jgi:hypothetical protein
LQNRRRTAVKNEKPPSGTTTFPLSAGPPVFSKSQPAALLVAAIAPAAARPASAARLRRRLDEIIFHTSAMEATSPIEINPAPSIEKEKDQK